MIWTENENEKYFGSRTIVGMTHSTFSNLKTIPDFPGWFYCLGLRSKAGRSCKNLCLHIISSFELYFSYVRKHRHIF